MWDYLLFFSGLSVGAFLTYKCMGLTVLPNDVKTKIRSGNVCGHLTVQTSIFYFDISGFDLIYLKQPFGFSYLAMPELSYFKTPFTVTVTDVEQSIHYNFTIDPVKSEYTDSGGNTGNIGSLLDLEAVIASPCDQE